MADIDTDRCESCGHPFEDWCDDECCWWKGEAFLTPVVGDVCYCMGGVGPQPYHGTARP